MRPLLHSFRLPSLRLSPSLSALLVGVLLVGLTQLLLGQDTTVVVDDKTGIFGPVVDKFWPVVVTFLTSLTVKVLEYVNKGFDRVGEPVKWAALYFAALGWNLLAGWLNLDATLEPGAPMFALSFVETAAAGLVYKFAGHKPPPTASAVR